MAEERDAVLVKETVVERPQKSLRSSAIAMQESTSLLRRADTFFAQGRVEEAERLYIQSLTASPESYDVKAQLAKFYLQTGREQKAEALYRDLLTTCDDVSYHANLGLAYYKQGKYKESCVSYHAAYTKDEKNPERCATLGRAYIAARRFNDAAECLEKACERLSRDTKLLHLLAECYLQVELAEKAQETYKRINKLEPYNEDVKEKLLTLAKA
tara:strand:- start:261 stop:902 length:642 start_codon:yes stop_codon:yes gene_type:complete